MVLTFEDAAGTAAEGFASGTRGFNTGVAGLLSSVVVIDAGGGVETPVSASWARTGTVTKMRAAVTRDSFMACLSSLQLSNFKAFSLDRPLKRRLKRIAAHKEQICRKGMEPATPDNARPPSQSHIA